MHSASIENSPRLQRILKVLSDGKRHTTRDIIRKASVCAVNSCISEIRCAGIDVKCERDGNLWRYWIVN